MKHGYSIFIQFVSVVCLFISFSIQKSGVAQDQEKMKNTANTSQKPDMFTLLFPVRNQLYPNYNPSDILVKRHSKPNEQFQQRESLNQHFRFDLVRLFSQKVLPEDITVVFIPEESIKFLESKVNTPEQKEMWKCLISFSHNDIYVTVVFIYRAVAVTFEYDEDMNKPKSLEEVCQKLSQFLPCMEGLNFKYDLPENQEIYQGNDFDESKLYRVNAKKEKVYSKGWLHTVRWWRGYGRFGISFENLPYKYYEPGGIQPQYVPTPYPYPEIK